MSDSDTALVARVIASDDRGAFELLVRRHQSAVRNFLRRLARNDAERANDLAQETFIKMYQGLHSYRGSARFTTWLFRIAYHTFLNDQRGRHANDEFSEDEHGIVADTTVGHRRCARRRSRARAAAGSPAGRLRLALQERHDAF